jgi:hypothetical protein
LELVKENTLSGLTIVEKGRPCPVELVSVIRTPLETEIIEIERTPLKTEIIEIKRTPSETEIKIKDCGF